MAEEAKNKEEFPAELKFSILNHSHEEYSFKDIEKRSILTEGGDKIKDKAKLFLKKQAGEIEDVYQDRLKDIVYYNYPSRIANDFASSVFTKELVVTGGDDDLNSFLMNCDNIGSTINQFMYDILFYSLNESKKYVGYDLPNNYKEYSSLQEQESDGALKPYLYKIPNESVIDWNLDFDNFTYLKIKNCYNKKDSVFSEEEKKVYSFSIWLKHRDGTVEYGIYEKEYKKNDKPAANDKFTLVKNNIVSYKNIPIFCFDMPNNLCIIDLIGSLVEEHIKSASALSYALRRNLFAVPVVQLDSELPEIGKAISEIQEDPNRAADLINKLERKGYLTLGKGDDFKFVEASGESFKIQNDKLKDIVNEIYRIVGEMSNSVVSNNDALARSGKSKQEDNRSKEILSEFFGKLVMSFVTKLINTIFEKEFFVSGLTEYRFVNRKDLISESVMLESINIPSKTFKTKLAIQNANDLAYLSSEERALIEKEITEFYENYKFGQSHDQEKGNK